MKLSEYINHLNQLLKENPAAKDYEVITSSDDEGNYFNPVYYSPSVGSYDSNLHDFSTDESVPDCVCLN